MHASNKRKIQKSPLALIRKEKLSHDIKKKKKQEEEKYHIHFPFFRNNFTNAIRAPLAQ